MLCLEQASLVVDIFCDEIFLGKFIVGPGQLQTLFLEIGVKGFFLTNLANL